VVRQAIFVDFNRQLKTTAFIAALCILRMLAPIGDSGAQEVSFMSKLKTDLNASVCLTDSERFSAERPGLKTVLTLERPGTINPLQIFSRTETERILGLSDRTFDRIEARGEGPPKTQLSPGRDGYRASDLAAWLDQRRMGASLDAYDPNLASRTPQRPSEQSKTELIEAAAPAMPKRPRGRPRRVSDVPPLNESVAS
jgi:predicted DNA-binding transcriptional regulator AlpA